VVGICIARIDKWIQKITRQSRSVMTPFWTGCRLVYLSVDVHRNIVRVNENSDWQLHDLRLSINTEINILEISYECSYMYTPPDVKYHNATAFFHVSTNNKKSSYSHSNKHVHSKKQNFLWYIFVRFVRNVICVLIVKNFPVSAARMIVVKKKPLRFYCWRKHFVTEWKSGGCCQNCKRKNHTSYVRILGETRKWFHLNRKS